MKATSTDPKFKIYTVHQTLKNGTVYVLEREQYWDPDQKKNIYGRQRLVGKILPGTTEKVDTRFKAKSKPKTNGNLPITKATRERVGLMKILDIVGKVSGIDEKVRACATNKGMADKIISLARYTVATNGASFSEIENWQLTHPIPYPEGISQSVYLDLFKKIGQSPFIEQNFFWMLSEDMDKEDVLVLDTSTMKTYSRLLDDATIGLGSIEGEGKNRKVMNVYKILVFYSIKKRMPVAFYLQRGNVPDVVMVKNALNRLAVLNLGVPTLLFDNGFTSGDNLGEIIRSGHHFLTRVKPSETWIAQEIDKSRPVIDRTENFCPFDKNVHGVKTPLEHTFHYERKRGDKKTGKKKGDREAITKKVYLYQYFDQQQALDFKEELERTLFNLKSRLEAGQAVKNMEEKEQKLVEKYLEVDKESKKTVVQFNQEAIDNNVEKAGWTTLLSDIDFETFDALSLYRIREYIEEFFKEGKDEGGMNKPRTGNQEELEGKTFVQFVGLLYRDYLRNKIRELEQTLGRENGDKEHDKKSNLKEEKKLLKWLDRQSLDELMMWFDGFEETQVSTQLLRKRWSDEMVKRDNLFIAKLQEKLVAV